MKTYPSSSGGERSRYGQKSATNLASMPSSGDIFKNRMTDCSSKESILPMRDIALTKELNVAWEEV